MGAVAVGVDIGQKRDPTAIVVVEASEELLPPPDPFWGHLVGPPGPGASGASGAHGAPARSLYTVRHLERLPLGTPYPQVVERIAQVVRRLRERDHRAEVQVLVDATGVGGPVVDVLRQRLADPVTAVILAPGERLTRRGQEARLGKAYLVSRLQVLLQQGQIRLPRTPEAQALGEELLNFEIRVSQDGHDTYGAFKVGAHDDLVIALGLATLYDPAALRVQYGPPLFV